MAEITREDLKEFGTGLVKSVKKLLDEQSIGVNERFKKMDDRLDSIDNRLDKIDDRLDKMDDRLDKIDNRLDTLESDMKEVKTELAKKPDRGEVYILVKDELTNNPSFILLDLEDLRTFVRNEINESLTKHSLI